MLPLKRPLETFPTICTAPVDFSLGLASVIIFQYIVRNICVYRCIGNNRTGEAFGNSAATALGDLDGNPSACTSTTVAPMNTRTFQNSIGISQAFHRNLHSIDMAKTVNGYIIVFTVACLFISFLCWRTTFSNAFMIFPSQSDKLNDLYEELVNSANWKWELTETAQREQRNGSQLR